MQEDVQNHAPIFEALEKARKDVSEFVEEGPEREQIEHELAELTSRFEKIVKRSEEREQQIQEVMPVAKDHEDAVKPVECLNTEAENVLKEKPKKFVGLETLEGELEKVKVIHKVWKVFVQISCFSFLFGKPKGKARSTVGKKDNVHRWETGDMELLNRRPLCQKRMVRAF